MPWKIEQLVRRTSDGAVISADWRCTLTDGADESLSATCIGVARLPEADPAAPDFVPYEDITPAIALAWVHAAIGEEEVAAIEARLLSELDEKRSPPIANGLPWQAPTEAPAEVPAE